MPAIVGVLETALYVADLERAAEFYRRVFGFEVMLADPRMRALSVASRQVLLLFEKGKSNQTNSIPGGVVPPHDGGGRLHLAFAIKAAELEEWAQFLAARGIAIESTVYTPNGATSLYFRDPDGHLIELATPGLWPLLISGNKEL